MAIRSLMEMPRAPAELSRLTRVIGDQATLALIEARGGTRLYIGTKARRRGQLSALQKEIGKPAAAALAAEFGHEYLLIPVARAWRCRVYKARGMTFSQIARTVGCSETTVYRIIAGDPEAKPRARMTEGQAELLLDP